jgi:hypothetical protein
MPCLVVRKYTNRWLVGLLCLGSLFSCMRLYSQAGGTISADHTRRAKKATVYIKVVLPGGEVAEGSGFFAMEPGLIVSNAHVLGMLRGQEKPTSLEVIINSGEPDEFRAQADILGVDRRNDLCVLRVRGDAKRLPAPLPLGSTRDLVELQKVYIFGFPFGARLGKNITVSESSVSSLRKSPDGRLQQIQVNGGIHPGNSGGPVLDAHGAVIGVAVAYIRGTQINFAIPADKIDEVLEGRVSEGHFLQPYRDGKQIKLPVELTCLDPLARIGSVHIEVWEGPAGPTRPGSPKPPASLAGDGPKHKVALEYKKGVGRVDLVLPETETGKTIWLQPIVVSKSGQSRWNDARPFVMSPPLERVPARLAMDYTKDPQRTIELLGVAQILLFQGNNKFIVGDRMELVALESLQTVPTGTAIDVRPGKAAFYREDDGRKSTRHSVAQNVVRGFTYRFIANAEGRLLQRTQPNVSRRAPPIVRMEADDMSNFLLNSYEMTCLSVPNRELAPSQTWKATVPILLATGKKRDVADLQLECAYEGTRIQDKKTEAYIRLSGRVQGRTNNKLRGQVTGRALVDLKHGFISELELTIRSDFDKGDLYVLNLFEATLKRVPGNPHNISPAQPGATPLAVATGKIVFQMSGALKATDPVDPRGRPGCVHQAFLVDLAQGKRYIIDLKKTPGSPLDPYLRLESENGASLAQDDDSGGALNARIVYRPARSGKHRIIATTFSPRQLGGFVLTVSEAQEGLSQDGSKIASSPGPVIASLRPEGQVVVKLSSPAQEAVLGADGTRMILHLAGEQKLAVLDLKQGKIVGHIPAPDEKAFFAAGKKSLVVVLQNAGTMELWDLANLTRIDSKPLPSPGVVKALVLGAGSSGPAMLVMAKDTQPLSRLSYMWLDLQTLSVRPMSTTRPFMHTSWRDQLHVRSSVDGAVFGMWCSMISPTGVTVLVAGQPIAAVNYKHTSLGHVLPSAQGNFVATWSGILNRNTQPVPEAGKGVCIPALEGDYYLNLGNVWQGAKPGASTVAQVFRAGDRAPVGSVSLENIVGENESALRNDFTLEKRIAFLPQTGILALLPRDNDRVVIQRLRVALKK